MSNTDHTQKKIQARRATAVMRRKFLEEQKPVPAEPLTKDEIGDLQNLVHAANKSNCAMIEAAAKVVAARANLVVAEQLLAKARAENVELHKAITPLFHRLPA